jgi:hypothetical protein
MRQPQFLTRAFGRAIRRQPARLLALTSLALLLLLAFASAATPAPAEQFSVVPDNASPTAGDTINVTVTAQDSSLVTDTGYLGTVTFASSDGQAVLPLDYTFTAGDSGVHVFAVTLKTAGSQTVTATDTTTSSITGVSGPISVAPDTAATLDLAAASTTPTAGAANDLTITAKDAYGNIATSYNGTKDLSFAGANASPDATNPTVTDNGGAARDFGQNTNIDFNDGVANVAGSDNGVMTLYEATASSIAVTDGSIDNSAAPLSVTVGPDVLDHFTWTDQPSASQTAGAAFDSVAVTAYDQWDNVKTDYNPAGAVFSGLGTSPNSDAPVYGFNWSSGVATSTTATDYTAETTQLKVTDGSVTASSDSGSPDTFTVLPAALNSFAWTDQPNAGQTAGVALDSVAVTAYDAFGNVKTNYIPAATFSGLNQSPSGCNADHTTVNPAGTFGCDPIYGFTWLAGVATSTTAKDYKAETTQLKVTDGSVTASSDSGSPDTFTVLPAALNRFAWTDQPGASQTAGVAFDSVAATAYDAFGNVKTNYNPAGAVFSGLNQSPRGCNADHTTVNPAGTAFCNPIYGFSWLAGVATSSTAKDYKAEISKLRVTDGSIFTDSSQFTVAPNAANVPPTFFNQQPTLTEKSTTINDTTGVQVTVLDAFGNPRSGDNVTVAIGTNPSAGILGGTLTKPSISGVATFNNLTINNPGLGYTLTATTGSALATSSAFDIANDVNTCGGTCSATGNTAKTIATVDASGLGGTLASRLGPAVAAAPTTARLGVTVAQSVPIPADVCGSQVGDGFAITVVQSAGNRPSYKVIATLDKAQVKNSGKTSPNSFDICLGAKNLLGTTAGCTSPATSLSWQTKNGSCAVLRNGLYWGYMKDYPSTVKSCPTTPGSGLFPGILSRNKTNAGDVVITFCKPADWDGAGGFH